MIPVELGRPARPGSELLGNQADMRSALRMPCLPVQALALPLLTITARSVPPATCCRPMTTGAARTRWS